MKYLLSIFRRPGRSLWRLIDNPKGESRSHACMDMTEPKGWGFAPSIMVLLLTIALVACGDDKGTSANDDNVSSSSSSSVIPASSGNRLSSSSKKIASSSSTPRNDVKSSSSNKALSSSSKRSDGDPSSSSQKIASSSSVKTVSSSSVILSSSSKQSSSSSKEIATSSSSSRNDVSSSSEYVPFDHKKTLANSSKVGEGAYKQFTDPRNGRSYYYIKIIGEDYLGKKDSVTIMAENLNIGKMVLGTEDQKDDNEIERYCYNNDTTKCDEFGGLYQWAEMMQLPSRCNTESCADLIQENHRGICPEGWRLMNDLDFYIAWHAETNSYGIRGTRSSYGFAGNNYSGLSLTGAGLRSSEGKFELLLKAALWFLPEEFEGKESSHAHSGLVASDDDYPPTRSDKDPKISGFSVRCVKLE